MIIKFWDIFRMLGTFSAGRVLNLLKITVSYYFTLFTGKVRHSGMPYSLSIEPTTSCNLRCPECPSGLRQFSRNTGHMDFDLFRNVIDQTSGHLIYLLLYFQGEPFLNPRFFDFVKYARSKRIYTATSTNAHFLTRENAEKTVNSGLDRILISLDGIGQETYTAYRTGGNYQRVIDGIGNLVEAKKRIKARHPYIILQFIVFGTNEHQIGDIRKLAKELCVDELQLKSAQVNDYKNGSPLIPSVEKYSRYRKRIDGTYEFKNPLPNRCFRMWSGNVITWDGLVVPCCFDKDAEHRLGDLKSDSFQKIWKSPEYREFRKKVFTTRKEIQICTNCTEGMKL